MKRNRFTHWEGNKQLLGPPSCVEPGDSLSCLKVTATCPYPEFDESGQHPAYLFQTHINIILTCTPYKMYKTTLCVHV